MGSDGTQQSIIIKENEPILEAMEERLWFVGNEMYEHSKGVLYYVMNHCHVRMGGLLAASIALRNQAETQEEKQTLINWTGMVMYKDGMAMNSLMPDGTSQEGVPYWEYGSEWLIKAGQLIRNAYDIDLFETTHVLEHSGDYLLYNLLSKSTWTMGQCLLNIGDSPTGNWNGPSLHLRFIAAEYGDATAQWLAQQIEEAGIDVWSSQWMSVLYADPDLEPVQPKDSETLKWFRDLDHVIARSDWSGNEDILSMKAGVPCGKNLMQMVQNGQYKGDPDAGHSHPDANHITLYSNGEFLLRDDGYSYKYASNHNTLLIGGQGQLGEGAWTQELEYINNNAVPQIKSAVSNNVWDYDYIVGDATEAYAVELGLELFERNVLYLKKEKVLLIVDNIRTSSEADLELRWYPASKAVAKSGTVYIAKSSNNVMNFYPLSENGLTSFEEVTVYGQDGVTSNEKTFRQTYTGTKWQNATAFSWSENAGMPAYVMYKPGSYADEHRFCVNEKIYTINVASHEISVEEGILESEDDADASNSMLSGILFNGVNMEGFDPTVTEYEIDRWWKTYNVTIDAYSAAYGAEVTVNYGKNDSNTVTLTCVSRDGSSRSVYTIHITNSRKILGIANVETDSTVGQPLSYIYDNIITPDMHDNRIWASENLPTLVFDLGKSVLLEDISIAFNLSSLRDSYFDVSVSQNGETYTYLINDGVVEKTPGTSTPSHSEYVKVAHNANIPVRYVKIKLRGQSTAGKDNSGAVNSIQEITFTGRADTEIDVVKNIIEKNKAK